MADSQDYYAPASYSPPPKKKGRPLAVFAVLLAVAGLGAAAFFLGPGMLESMQAEEKPNPGGDPADYPAPGVRAGTPLEWRTLRRFDWTASEKRPRPELAVADFTADGSEDVLIIDWGGDTEVVQLEDLSSEVLAKADHKIVADFYTWDVDADGVSEIVPASAYLQYVPEVKSWVRIKGVG